MRSADAVTLLRVPLILLLAYMVFVKFSALADIILMAIIFAMDALDGFYAVKEAGKGSVSFYQYLSAALGNAAAKARVSALKKKIKSIAPYGPRLDVAGDRVIEYTLWVLFTYLHIVPLIILLLVVVRHSFADALMGAKGTSSKMKTKFASVIYSSNLWRGGINVVKFVTFAYLVMVYVSGYPIDIGYILVGILFTYIMLRGAAEIYESLKA